MKKIFIFVLCMLILPITCKAVDYDIEHYYINATINSDGSMDVEELIVMDGTFNGYGVSIEYSDYSDYSATAMSNVSISGFTNFDTSSLSIDEWNYDYFYEFELVDYAYSGDSLVYTQNLYSRENSYKMYYSTYDSTTAFLFKYTLEDVAILHADCVEVYWNFFSSGFSDDIEDLQIRINIPDGITYDDIHWWFHGDLAGSSEWSNGYILATLDELDAYTALDFRILLPESLFSGVSKTDSEEVVDSIIEEEDAKVAQDLANIARIRNIYYTFVVITVIFFIVLIIAWIYVYRKYDKERKPKFQNKYNREFIDDYNVEVVDYLMNGTISDNAMSASIMNLIYKKNISYEKLEDKKENYVFTLENRDNLNDTENMLIDFLFGNIGSDNKFSTIDLKNYSSSIKTGESFMNSYTKWKNKVLEDAKEQHFYDDLTGKMTSSVILFVISCIISFVGVIYYQVEFIPLYFITIVSFIFVFYSGMITRKSETGIEDYAKWKGFKNFLTDFGDFPEKELPQIELWERYLVYATLFGIADKVEKVMNVKISEMNAGTMAGVYILPNPHIAIIVNSSVHSSINNAHMAVSRANANASGGTFGGHGGGFSSGGGFGGGGRSGGGF